MTKYGSSQIYDGSLLYHITSPTLRNLENTVISRFEIDFKDMYIVCCPGFAQLGGLVLGSLLHTLAHTKDY